MKHLGIDLGTSNTLIYLKGQGIVLRAPTVVAVDEKTNKVLAVGNEAKMMLGKTPGSIQAIHPIKNCVIAEFDATAAMLRHYFKHISGNTIFSRPRVLTYIPYGATEVERRAIEDVTIEGGAQSVGLVTEPIAAAVGCGLRIDDPRGSMVIDMGGGTTSISVLSLGGIVVSKSIRVGGDALDEAIIKYFKKKFNVLIGEVTAEMLKVRIGSADPSNDRGKMEIRGRNLLTGLPAILQVSSAEIREAVSEPLIRIMELIRNTLETTPPELAADIFDTGIMLTGGTSLFAGIDLLISRVTGIKTFVAKNPIDSVALGLGRIIESGSNMNGTITYRSR